MRAWVGTIWIVLMISACSPNTNRSLGSIHLGSGTEPFPEDFRETVRRYIEGRAGAEDAALMISRPETLVGQTAFDPLRWYSCVIGLQASNMPPQRAEPLLDKLEQFVTQADHSEQYQVIVIFRDGYAPYVIEAFGSRLCRDQDYQPLGLTDRT